MTDMRYLYMRRAEMAEAESELQDIKKYCRYNGVFWRLFDWLERKAADWRQEYTDEINERMAEGGKDDVSA